jgi:hypothetical protein
LFASRQARPTLTQGRFPPQRKRFAEAVNETNLLQFRYRCRQISQTHDLYRYSNLAHVRCDRVREPCDFRRLRCGGAGVIARNGPAKPVRRGNARQSPQPDRGLLPHRSMIVGAVF